MRCPSHGLDDPWFGDAVFSHFTQTREREGTVENPFALDYSLWIVPGSVLIFSVIVTIVLLIIEYHENREIAKSAQDMARCAKNLCHVKIIGFDQEISVLLTKRVDTLASETSMVDSAVVRTLAESLKQAYRAASSRYSSITSFVTSPNRNGLSVERYMWIAKGFEGILGELEMVRIKKDEFETEFAALEERVGNIPQRVTDTQDVLAGAKTVVIGLQQRVGLKTGNADEIMVDAEFYLSLAVAALADKHHREAGVHCDGAIDKAEQAIEVALLCMQQRDAANAAISALEARIEVINTSIASWETTYAELVSAYAPACTVDLSNHAGQRVFNDAVSFLEDARALASLELQEWEACMCFVDDANLAIDKIEEYFVAVHEQKRILEDAKVVAPAVVDVLTSDIEIAQQYAGQHVTDDVSVAAQHLIEVANNYIIANIGDIGDAILSQIGRARTLFNLSASATTSFAQTQLVIAAGENALDALDVAVLEVQRANVARTSCS